MATDLASNVADYAKKIKETGTKLENREGIMPELPELVKKALPVAKQGGPVITSVYALYRSFELYDRAIKDYKKDYKTYRDKFERLNEEMKQSKDFLVKKLIPLLEKGDDDDKLQKVTVELQGRISDHSTELGELIKAIHRSAKKARSDTSWSAFYSGIAVAAFVGSIAVGVVPVSVVAFGAGAGTIACNVLRYTKNSDTLTKLDTLGKHAMAKRAEITNYNSKIHIARMTGQLEN